jgi:heme A synthase
MIGPWKLSTFVLGAALAAAVAAPNPARAAADPRMAPVLYGLQAVVTWIQAASALKSDDPGGHRANAINLTNEAIAEIQADITAQGP